MVLESQTRCHDDGTVRVALGAIFIGVDDAGRPSP